MTSVMGLPAIRRARSAMEQAPAVCELDGPTISGPSTSNVLIKAMVKSSLMFQLYRIDIFLFGLYHENKINQIHRFYDYH